MPGVMAATIQSNGVPMFLEKMGMLLEFGKVEDAQQMVQQLKGWANGFAEKAQAPRTAPTQGKGTDKLAEREQALQQRESQAFNADIQKGAEDVRMPLITKELESSFSRRPKEGGSTVSTSSCPR